MQDKRPPLSLPDSLELGVVQLKPSAHWEVEFGFYTC